MTHTTTTNQQSKGKKILSMLYSEMVKASLECDALRVKGASNQDIYLAIKKFEDLSAAYNLISKHF